MRDAAEIVGGAVEEVLEKYGTSKGVKRGWKTRKGELPPVAETPGGSPKKPKDYPKGYKPGKKGKGPEAPKKRSEIEAPPEMAAEPVVAEETPGGKKLTQEGVAAVAEGAKASAAADRAAKIDGPEAKRKATEARRLAQSAKQRAGKGKTEDAQALADRAKKVAAEAVAAAKESQRKKAEGGAAKEPAAGETAPPPAEEPGAPEGPGTSPEAAAEEVRTAQGLLGRARGELSDVIDPGFKAAHPEAQAAADQARGHFQSGESMAQQAAEAAQAGDHDQAARLSLRARDAFLDAADAAVDARSPIAPDAPEAQRSAHARLTESQARMAAARKRIGEDSSTFLRYLDRKMRNEYATARSLYDQGRHQESLEASKRADRTAQDMVRHVSFGHVAESAERSYLHQPAVHDARKGIAGLRGRAEGATPARAAEVAEETARHGAALDEKIAAGASDGSLPPDHIDLWRGELAEASSAVSAARAEASQGNPESAARLLAMAHAKQYAVANEVEGALVLGMVRGVAGGADQLHSGQAEEFADLSRRLVGAAESGESIAAALRQEILNREKRRVPDVPGGGKIGDRARAMLKDVDARTKDAREAKKKAEKAAKDAGRSGKVTDGHRSAFRSSQRELDSALRQVSSMWRDFLKKMEQAEERAVAGKSLAEGEMTDRNHAEEIVKGAMAKAGTSEGAARGWETRRGKRPAAEEEQPGAGGAAGQQWVSEEAGQSVSALTSQLDGAQWMWQEGAPDPSGIVHDEGHKQRERAGLIHDAGTSAKQTAASLPEGHLGRAALEEAGSLATSRQAYESEEGYTQATRAMDQARRVLTGYASDEEIAQIKQDLGAKVRERSQYTGEAIPDWAQEGGEGGAPAAPAAPEPAPEGDMPVPPGEAQQRWPSGNPVGEGESESDRVQLADALRNAIGEEEEPVQPENPAEKARRLVAEALAKAGTSEGAKRGWETRRGRSPAEETPAEERGPALEERETVEMPGEAHEEVLPGGPTPELEEMVTPEAVGPEPETEALPETPAGEAGAPPAEAPAAEAKPQWRPNTTPWRGRERPGPTHGEDYHPDLPELRQILEGEDMSDALDSGGPLGGIFDDAAAYLNENTEEDAWEMDSPDRIRDLYGGINESAEFGLAAAEALDAAADRLRREGALDDDDYGEVQAALEEARDKLDETRWAADHGRPKPGAKLSPEDVWVKPGVEAMRKLDDVWGRLHTAHEARIGPEGEIMSNKSGAGLGLGLGRFSKFADTREGRVEKAKAALLEKSGGARPGGLFDALLPGDLRQGSRVAAPNPETHRKL